MPKRRPPDERARTPDRTWLLLLVPLLVLVASLTLSYLWNEDFWWYLSSGQAILENGGIPDQDPFLYTSGEGIGWVYHSWLWTVVVALVAKLAGLEGVVFFHALMASAIVVLLYTGARVDRLGLANALAGLLFVAIVGHRLTGKTELATWLLVAVFYRILEMRGPFTWKRGVALGALQVLWANLHGGYPLGIFVALCYSVGGWLQQRFGRSKPGPAYPPLWFPALLFLLAVADPGLFYERLAPFGFVTGSQTVQPVGASGTLLILEWRSPFTEPTSTWHFLVAATLGLASFVAARRWPLPRLFLLLGTIGLGMSAIRHLSVLALVAALVLLSNLAERQPRRAAAKGKKKLRPPARGQPRLYLLASGLLAVFLLASAVSLRLARPGFEAGRPESFFTMKPAMAPSRAVDFLVEKGLPGPIFNDYVSGAYLGARLYPDQRVFIDSRVLDPSVVVDYTEMVDSERSWRQAAARYGFRTAILGNYSTTVRSPLGSTLTRDRDWRLVYVDALAVIFVRSDAAPASLRREVRLQDELRSHVPFSDPPGYFPWVAALQRIFLDDTPSNYLIEYLAILGHLGQTREVFELADKALEIMPDHPLLYRQRCAANFVQGRLQAAVSDCERAHALRPDDAQIASLYVNVLERAGNRMQARRIAAEALGRHPESRQLQELYQRLTR